MKPIKKQAEQQCAIPSVMRCLQSEIDKLHYQSRENRQCYLQALLHEIEAKGNIVTELTRALEMYLEK